MKTKEVYTIQRFFLYLSDCKSDQVNVLAELADTSLSKESQYCPTVAAKLVGTNSQHAGIILGIGDSPQQAKSVQVAPEHCLPLLDP